MSEFKENVASVQAEAVKHGPEYFIGASGYEKAEVIAVAKAQAEPGVEALKSAGLLREDADDRLTIAVLAATWAMGLEIGHGIARGRG